MEKDFTEWNRIKGQLHTEHPAPTFQEREVWWCSIGINVGHETDGKSQYATRPVIVIRKFNPHIFLGVPLTTQIKENPFYQPIHFKEREQCAMLSQLRLWSAKRLRSKLGKLPQDQFEAVRNALRDML